MEYLDNKQRYKKQREAGTTISHAYDLQGNILALRRNGRLYGSVYGVTDDLTYEYDGNRLTKVTNLASERSAYKDAMYYVDWADLDTERTYDANGNMVSDADRQITRISYDRQNLPRRIDYLDGSHVDYTYDADGVKLRVDYYLSPYIMVPGDEFGIAVDSTQLVHTWREYVGNSVYENDTLRMVLIDGGYITFDGASHQPLYHYYAKDYLGNNRAVTDEAGRIEEINHYYPFGGLMGDSWATATQPYKYIGKELDRTHGLDWYDHGARHYDPVTGRWNVADAMAEKYYSLSPYVSCGDDPVDAVDIDGYICIFINGFSILPQGRKYWQTSSGDFVAKVQSHFHDYAQPLFYDGSIGGLPRLFAPNKIPYEDNSNLNLNLRYNAGYDNGQSVAGKIIKQLKRDKIGRIIEPVRIISHSMGGAYAKGFAQALIEYVKKHPKITSGLKISEYDFAPYTAS